jgi:putative ATPase
LSSQRTPSARGNPSARGGASARGSLSARGNPGAPSLFQASAQAELARRAPLAERMRPRSLDDIVGQSHLVGPSAPFRLAVEQDRLASVILWGPPGSGKTTLARAVASVSSKAFRSLHAADAGVREVRVVLDEAQELLGREGQGTILFLDEIHRFSKSQQDVLLDAVERGMVVLFGATTENPFFEVNPPLLSRATLLRLEPLSREELAVIARRALEHEGWEASEEAISALVGLCGGDARALLNALENAMLAARAEAIRTSPRVDQDEPAALRTTEATTPVARSEEPSRIELSHVQAMTSQGVVLYGADEHYDMASAFIKSIRGSDPDAGIYWLVRMIESGEDPRFLARRLVILASEDVGLADPHALQVAVSAAAAVEHVGLPEAALNLGEAVVYLALAPKSNSVTVALERAREAVKADKAARVPNHLRDSHYQGASSQGFGKGYVYPHDTGGWTPQRYLPASDALEARLPFYSARELGEEASLVRRWQQMRQAASKASKASKGGSPRRESSGD